MISPRKPVRPESHLGKINLLHTTSSPPVEPNNSTSNSDTVIWITVCMGCDKVRDSDGAWHRQNIDQLKCQANIELTHGICSNCTARLYPDILPTK